MSSGAPDEIIECNDLYVGEDLAAVSSRSHVITSGPESSCVKAAVASHVSAVRPAIMAAVFPDMVRERSAVVSWNCELTVGVSPSRAAT